MFFLPLMADSAAKRTTPQGSLLRTYKPGQGFWTRVGTGIGAGLVILFTVYFLHGKLPVWTPLDRDGWLLYAILTALTLVLAGVAWYLINRPKNAEFLIETDQEMKKVAWPTWFELIGSTRVVIIFMFFIAFVLFMYDVIFGSVMYGIAVNRIAPFFFGAAEASPQLTVP